MPRHAILDITAALNCGIFGGSGILLKHSVSFIGRFCIGVVFHSAMWFHVSSGYRLLSSAHCCENRGFIMELHTQEHIPDFNLGGMNHGGMVWGGGIPDTEKSSKF